MSNRVLKNVLAIFCGLVVGIVCIMLMQMVSTWLYATDEPIDSDDRDAVVEFVQNLPLGAFCLVLASYSMGSFFGGFTAGSMAASYPFVCALMVGAALLAGGIINLTQIPHPLWFAIISTLVYIPFAGLGARMRWKSRSNT